MIRWGRFAVAYLLMGAISAVTAIAWRNGSPLEHPDPWLVLPSTVSHAYSTAVGAAFGALVVVLTRFLVVRYAWARNLHRELRPLARGISATGIGVLALLSAIGEELLFRGLLQPWLGLWISSIVFGFVHQIRGPSRWVWVAWATVVGFILGLIFKISGSLTGCIAAHAIINWLNLAYLKSHDPEPRPRALGGLLGSRS